MGLSLDKIAEKAPELLSLAKESALSLNKRGLNGTVASVALCLDYSGSMSARYRSGEVQALAERALALGTQLDDDGAIDVFAFDSGAEYLGQLTLDNYKGGVDRLLAGRRMGTTNYAAAFEKVAQHYNFGVPNEVEKKGFFGRKKAVGTPANGPASQPVFVLFETDGAPDNPRAASDLLLKISALPIFWKFLSVGHENIAFLEKLDDMSGRVVDNADYKPVGDLSRLSDSALFDMLLDEYPGWLTAARQANILG